MTVTTTGAPKNVLILGANSPLGIELVKGFLKLEECQNVFATYRTKASAEALLRIAEEELRLKTIELDLRIPHFCQLHEIIKSWVSDDGLNAIINVAGIFTEKQSICDLEQQEFLKFMQVNAISPLLVILELLPLLVKASALYANGEVGETGLGRALVANVTSVASEIDGGGLYMTRSSRAALNAATKALAVDLLPKNIVVVGLKPNGFSSSPEPNNEDCYVAVEASAAGLMCVLGSVNISNSGHCYDYKGKHVPW